MNKLDGLVIAMALVIFILGLSLILDAKKARLRKEREAEEKWRQDVAWQDLLEEEQFEREERELCRRAGEPYVATPFFPGTVGGKK